jgi:hypothetical protein
LSSGLTKVSSKEDSGASLPLLLLLPPKSLLRPEDDDDEDEDGGVEDARERKMSQAMWQSSSDMSG